MIIVDKIIVVFFSVNVSTLKGVGTLVSNQGAVYTSGIVFVSKFESFCGVCRIWVLLTLNCVIKMFSS